MEPIKEAWVFVDMPIESAPVLAGRLVIGAGQGQFVYGKSYLARPDAFALDPVNLPLVSSTQQILGNDGVPAVLLDGGRITGAKTDAGPALPAPTKQA